MRPSNRVIFGMLAALFAFAALARPAMAFDSAVIQSVYSKHANAICMVSYASDVTNAASGEVTKREPKALGVIVNPDGLVMTHGHMQVENSAPYNVRVTVGHGAARRTYDAAILSKPKEVNLCFVRIQTPLAIRFPSLAFGGSAPGLGDEVLVLGMLGDTLDNSPSIQTRLVGAILEEPRKTLCLDDAVPFGFLTGPVFTQSGEAVGVVGYDLSPQEGGDIYIHSGHPLLFQTSLFENQIQNPPGAESANGNAPNGWLGVFTQPLTDDLAAYWGLPANGGIIASTIVQGSPAEKSGLRRGDVIVGFNGAPVTARHDRDVFAFTRMVRDTAIGQEVEVLFLREGQPQSVKLTLADRPKTSREASEFEDSVFGLTVREITRDLRVQLNIAEEVQGVIVRRVKSGSVAQLAGVIPGVIIITLDGSPVKTVDEFEKAVAALAAKKPVEVAAFCRIGPKTGFYRMMPRWNAVQ